MKKLHLGLMAFGILAIGQVSAQATIKQAPKMTPEQRFDKIDTNKDGAITLEEIKRAKGEEAKDADARFKKMDANADGKVTKTEFLKKKEEAGLRKVENGPKNEGIKIKKEEPGVRKVENETKKEEVGIRKVEKEEADNDDDDKKENEKPKMTPDQKFTKMDTNKDGFITLDEIKRGKGNEAKDGENRFKKMDANADGKVSKAEFLAKKEGNGHKKDDHNGHKEGHGKKESKNKK